MRTRKLGKTDLDLTTIGLGTWAIGGPWEFGWGAQDDDDSVATIITALESGINWIDTAPIYGCGHSETVVGRAIREFGEKTLVATKCSLLWNEQRCKVSCLDADSIIKECEDSLRRLGVEVIDLYQMHWPQPKEDVEQAWEEMAKLLEEGKVRYIGVSNFNIEQIERIQKIAAVSSLQPPYSMIHRKVEDELLGYCTKNNMGVIVYSPMQRGLLTGKFSQERLSNLPLDDHRRRSQDFHEPQFTATMELVDKLKKIADEKGQTCAQLAISWVLRRNEVTTAIVGARRPEQIKETAKAADWKLSESEIEQIKKLLAEWDEKTLRRS